MKKLVLALALLFWTSLTFGAEAQTFRSASGDVLVLVDAPCTLTAGVFATMPDEIRPKFKAAVAHIDGQNVQACWAKTERDTHFIIDQSGAYGEIEGSSFMPDPKV